MIVGEGWGMWEGSLVARVDADGDGEVNWGLGYTMAYDKMVNERT